MTNKQISIDSKQEVSTVETGATVIGTNIENLHVSQPAEKSIPLERPQRADFFTNRTAALDQLLTTLQPGQVATLCGPGGIGKTALAAEAIWTLAPDNEPPEQFPDGVLFHSFYGQPNTDIAFEKIALAYGEEPKPTPLAAAQRVLGRRRALLVLDSAEEADNLSQLLEVRGSSAVLVTSRQRKDALTERQDMAPLEMASAIELLQKWGGKWAVEKEAVTAICKQVGGLPLAVRLVGRYLMQMEEEAESYLGWLQETPIAALSDTESERKEESVTILLEQSMGQVGEVAQQVLAIMGQLALQPMRPVGVAAGLGVSEGRLRQAWRQLLGYGLLQKRGNAYEVTHPLIHTYASRRLRPAAEDFERLVDYYIDLTATKTRQGSTGYHRLDEERAHVMQLIADCFVREAWGKGMDLVEAVYDYLSLQGHATERLLTLKHGVAFAQQTSNLDNEFTLLLRLGTTYRDLGQVKKAIDYCEKGLSIAQKIGNRHGEANGLGILGTIYHDSGQVEKAIGHHEQALAIAQEIGNHQRKRRQLHNLGNAYRDLGQFEKAIEFFQQALIINREIGNRQGEGRSLGSLGTGHYALGQREMAIEFYQQALIISRELGYRQGEGIHLANLGLTYGDLGQLDKTIDYYEQALAVFQEIGFRRGESGVTGNLGFTYISLGQVEKAIDYIKQSIVINREIGFRLGEGVCLGDLGLAYSKLGQTEQAMAHYEQALAIAREIGHRESEGNQLHYLGVAHHNLGQLEEAIKYTTQALAIFEAMKSPNLDQVQQLLKELETKTANQPTK